MKLSSFIALGVAAGIALATFASAEFTALIPAEIVFAASASLAIAGLMIADYRRYVRPHTPPVPRVIRPTAPAAQPQRTLAYGIRRQSRIGERAA